MRKLYTIIALCMSISIFAIAGTPVTKATDAKVQQTVSQKTVLNTFTKSVSVNGVSLKKVEGASMAAQAKAPAALADIVGVYDYTYHSYLNNDAGDHNSKVTIEIVDETDGLVSLDGLYPGRKVEGIYDAESGVLTIPSQKLFTNTHYEEDVYLCIGQWDKEGKNPVPSSADFILEYANNGFAQVSENENGNVSLAATLESWLDNPNYEGWFFLSDVMNLTKQVPAEWSVIGTAQFLDGSMFAGVFGATATAPSTVNVEKDAAVKGRYRLVGPWNELFGEELPNSYLEFNCANVENVVIPEQKTGLGDRDWGAAFVQNNSGMFEAMGREPSYYLPLLIANNLLNKLVDNKITIPVGTAFTTFENQPAPDNIFYITAEKGGVDSYIVLDESVMKDIKEAGIGTGVDAIVTTTADANGKAYNVMGQQVNAANAKGIIIKNGKKFITNK